MNILAVGAHPDDIEYGMGGTAAKHVTRGDDVYFLILTYGEKTRPAKSGKKEAEQSAKILGVRSVYFGGLKDTRVANSIETIRKIEKALQETDPDRVYCPCLSDQHQDHRNCAYSVATAARGVRQVLQFELPYAHFDFSPRYYVPIDDVIDVKMASLKSFRSQTNRIFMKDDAVRSLARYRGYLINCNYAEAFEILRFVEL